MSDSTSRAQLAALRLVPANAGAATRLEALRLQPIDRLRAGSSREGWLDRAVRSEIASGFLEAEDHQPQPFTDRIVLHRALTVMPGPRDDSVFVTRMLLRSLFLELGLAPSIRSEAEALALIALGLADGICQRAGLEPYLEPRQPGDIEVPDHDRLLELSSALRWTPGEIDVLGPRAEQQLKRLAQTSFAPVQRARGEWVVTAPDDLLPAFAEAVVALFRAGDDVAELQRRYDAAIWSNVLGSISRLGFDIDHRLPPDDESTAAIATFEGPYGARTVIIQRTSSLQSQVERASGALPLIPLPSLPADLNIAETDTVLTVGQPLADPYFDCQARTSGPWEIGMAAADLEVLSHLFAGDDGLLRRFARAANLVRVDADVIRYSTLDEFSAYSDNGESFWWEAVDRSAVFLLRPGTALPLRMRFVRDLGVTAASWPGGGTVEVIRRYFGDDIPIYTPPVGAPFVGRAILIGGRAAWVIADWPSPPGLPSRAWLEDAVGIVDVAAFWLWQLAPVFSAPLIAAAPGPITLKIEVPPGGLADGLVGPVSNQRPIDVSIETDSVARLSFPGPIQSAEPSNAGDRAVAAAVLSVVRAIAGAPISPEAVAEAVSAVASPETKRMLLPIDLGWNAAIAQADTPILRKVSKADVELWRDWSGQRLLEGQWRPGPIANSDDRSRVFREAVGDLFAELEATIARHHPGLVRTLVGQSEALYRSQAIGRLNYVTSVACFGEASNAASKAAADLLAIDQPPQAIRFLIEYAAARPPSGTVAVTAAALDRLIALASLIIDLGLTSDAIHYAVPDASLAIAKRGRLLYGPEIQIAMGRFGTGMWRRVLVGAEAAYGGHWVSAQDLPERGEDLTAINTAYQDEFGYSLSEHALFLNGALLFADETDESVIEAPRSQLVIALSRHLGWTRERAGAVLGTMTIGPRHSFAEPPPGLRAAELYPWRFNRSMSYLRRPFVALEDDGDASVLFGTRHLAASAPYLFAQVASGRLQAHSPTMRRLQGRVAAQEAEAFVEEVATQCRTRRLDVQVNVKRLADRRIAGPTGDLGDIDVLAIDRERSILWLLECKALQAARTPWELHSEIRKLAEPGGFIDRHLRRRDWVRDNLAAISASFGLAAAGVSVRALVVTPVALLASEFGPMKAPVIALDSLGEVIDA